MLSLSSDFATKCAAQADATRGPARQDELDGVDAFFTELAAYAHDADDQPAKCAGRYNQRSCTVRRAAVSEFDHALYTDMINRHSVSSGEGKMPGYESRPAALHPEERCIASFTSSAI